MATLIERFDIRTNQEQRAIILTLHREGYVASEIGRLVGVTPIRIGQVIAAPRPGRTRTLTRVLDSSPATATRGTCPECGSKCGTCGVSRCRACERAGRSQRHNDRIEALKAWAQKNGVIPSVRQATEITGLGRSYSGDLVNEAFGPHPLNGQARRIPRRYPIASA